MQMVDMFFDELEDAKKRRVPFIIPIGTIEYHAHHASCGTDTMCITGMMRELEKQKEIVVCPPIWYGVASYAVAGPESGTIHVDVAEPGTYDIKIDARQWGYDDPFPYSPEALGVEFPG